MWEVCEPLNLRMNLQLKLLFVYAYAFPPAPLTFSRSEVYSCTTQIKVAIVKHEAFSSPTVQKVLQFSVLDYWSAICKFCKIVHRT